MRCLLILHCTGGRKNCYLCELEDPEETSKQMKVIVESDNVPIDPEQILLLEIIPLKTTGFSNATTPAELFSTAVTTLH